MNACPPEPGRPVHGTLYDDMTELPDTSIREEPIPRQEDENHPADDAVWLGKADWIALAVALGLAVLVRAVYLVQSLHWPYLDQPISDAALYVDRARGVLAGYWPAHNMAHSQGPLYPYLLAAVLAITETWRLLLYAQMAIGCASVALVYLIARRGGNTLSAVLATLLCVAYGPLVANEGKLLTESLATFLSLLAVYGLVRQIDAIRWGWIAVIGIALGAAAGLRPSYLMVVPLAAAWVGWRHRRIGGRPLLAAAVMAALAALMIAPWTYQNYRAERVFIPISSAGGITFFLGNNPTAAGTLSLGGVLSGGVGTQNEEQLARAEAVLGRKLNSAQASSFWYKRALRFIYEHPRWWAWIMWRKLRLHFSSVEVANVYSFHVERSVIPVLWVLAVPFGLIGSLGLVGLVLSARRPAAHPILILLGVGLLTCMVFYTSSRFRMPTVPLMAILAGWGVQRAIAWWTEGRRTKTLAALGATLCLTVLMLWPVGGPLPSPMLFGKRNLALMLGRAGEPDRGRAILQSQLQPDVPIDDRGEAYLALGRLESDQRRYPEAITALTKALELDPRNFAPYRDLAKANYEFGRYSQAADNARALLDKNQRDIECRVILGRCLARQKRWAEAVAELEKAAQLAPSNPGVLYYLGDAYMGLHQYDKAIEAFRQSSRHTENVDIMISLAYCHAQINQRDQARAILARILARDPENRRAKALVQKIGGLAPRGR
ncbi:MAG: tetratricopeptide repeat protein [Phycisphaerae bacterium]|nr:tetratricopeptide repeat protein [Phycisphaerae bacterium]